MSSEYTRNMILYGIIFDFFYFLWQFFLAMDLAFLFNFICISGLDWATIGLT